MTMTIHTVQGGDGRMPGVKADLVAVLGGLAELADEIGLSSLRDDLLAVRRPRLEEERFDLVVLGEFNCGKTTFVNALLGADVLPTGITPTTAILTRVSWAEQPSARAELCAGGSQEIDLARLRDFVTSDGREVGRVRLVEVGYPAELLRQRVTLVDTPGVNDLCEQRAEITYGTLPQADAVLFLLDASQVLRESERAFLEQRILRRTRDKLLFVVAKSDLLSAAELTQVMAYAREHLRAVVADPEVLAVAARKWASDPEASGMAPLLDRLRRYLGEQKTAVLLDNAAWHAARTVASIRNHLGIRRASLKLPLDELERRVLAMRAALDGARQTVAEQKQEIAAEAAAIQAMARHELAEFLEQFQAALPGEIERAEASDIKRYLQFFIQDTLKAWAEEEGELIATRLERMAERTLKVTNENVRQVMGQLSERFGPAETRIDLEVDTLKYDVGVFALGALGTTVFLFANTLVGGLLALSAPLLALVLRGRVAEEVKAQARARAPEVLTRAGEIAGPRLEAMVEEFAGRLSAFVAEAGDALHRNISEVIDRALADRRAYGEDAAAGERELEQVLRRLEELERRLAATRTRLWPGGSGAEHPGEDLPRERRE